MSNVLCPIVARYSLFFTLALFDSSMLARSKHPKEVALDMVQKAQEQSQARLHANAAAATKLRALIRNVSTASSSSASSSSTSSTSSCRQSQSSSASTAPTILSSTVLSSFPKSEEDALSTVTQLPQVSSVENTTTTTSTTTTILPSSISPPTSRSLILSSTSSSSPSSQKRSSKKTRASHTRRASSKPSHAITTLLSISITIILLSLLQSRSRYQYLQQKTIVTQGSHSNSRRHSHRRRRHQHQLQQRQPQQQGLVSTDCVSPSSPSTQLLYELHYKEGDSATCIPDTLDKVKNTSSHIKATASANSPASSSLFFASSSTSTTTMIVHPHTTSTSTTPITTASSINDDNNNNKQIRNEYVAAWLSQQTIDPFECDDYHHDANQMEDHYHITVSQQHHHQYLHPDTTTSSPHYPHSSYYHPLPQANHPPAPTSRGNLPHVHGHGHRRCLSLMNPMTSPVTPTMAISYEEQLQHQLEWHRQNYQLLHASTTTNTIIPQYSDEPVHPFTEEPILVYWPPERSAEDLAWERHNYYLRLQAEEEDLIERLQSDRKQGRELRVPSKTLNQLWQPRLEPSSSVARAGSLNRLAGQSMLSAETSRVLGLCRTSTLSAVKKIGFAKKDATNRSSRSTSPMLPIAAATTTSSNIDDDRILTQGLGIHCYGRTATTSSNMTVASASSSTFFSFSPKSSAPSAELATITNVSPSLPSKKLIKDHFGPSLKSLARRCSTRFCRSPSRPNSYSGPAGDATVDYPLGRRSLGSYPSQQPQKQRGHLYDFKQLPTGPTGGSTEISKSSSRFQEGRPQRSLTTERVPVHRTVTLFRSKSTRAPASASMVAASKKDDRRSAQITTVLDLPYRPHRNSLRFANGRGLDFSSTPSLTASSTPSHSTRRSSVDIKAVGSSDTGNTEKETTIPAILATLVNIDESTLVISSAVPTSVLDLEEHESMRQQIVAILSLDRNDMRRRPSSKPRTRSTTPGLSSSSEQPSIFEEQQKEYQQEECLSPLAVEAQEILPEDHLKTIQEQEVAAELADPCEHIAFMLVPKAQYEFQPLIAH